MKTFMFCLVWLFLSVATVLGQTEFITFPVDGAVFQQDSVGNHTFTFGGQVKNTQPMYYRLEKKNNSGSWIDVSGQKDKSLNYHYTHGSGSAQRQLFYESGVNLNVGWYRLTIYRKYNVLFFISKRVKKHSVEFGVGDVYFIAGQSNASGYGGSGYYIQNTIASLKDNTVSSILNNSAASPMARVFDSKMDEQGGKDNYHLNATQKPLTYAIPYKAGFRVFENGNTANPNQRPEDLHPIDGLPRSGNRLDDRIGIYPNGYNSWYWAPLAHKIANPNGVSKYSGTPTLWFNVASPSTILQDNSLDIVNIWDINPNLNSGNRSAFLSRPFNQTLMGKFKQTLETYAGPFGAKGVLWHQGEADHEAIMNNSSYVSVLGYQNSLTAIINKSREYATGSSSNTSLNWFVAKTTLLPNSASITNSSISTGISISTIPNNGSYKGEGGLTDKLYTSANLRSNQTSGLANVFEGPNTDNINSLDGNFQRSNHYFVHFSGNSLQKAADSWYNKLSQTTNSLSPTTPIRITKVIKNSPTSYSITVDNSIGSNEFVWVVDSYGLNNWYSQGTTNNITFNGVQPDYFLHGYAKKNGRWHAIVPFMVPGGNIEAKGLRLSIENLLIPASGQTSYIDVTSVDVDWEIQNSYPSWLTVDYDEDESQLKIITSPNSGNSTRVGYVELKEIGGSVIKTITINQEGTGGGSGSTSLTTLSPTNSSSEWSGYGTTRFDGKTIDANTMQVSGVQYNQGIGTHANSRIVYHLGGAYNTFTGLVGRDDEADNSWDGGKVVFSVKLDGSTVWTSAVHGNTTNAEPFNISVSGKNNLELIVDKHTDENHGDHANWMNVYLSGSGGCSHAAPTAVSATPVPYGGGNTTLSATCESGKTVQWSNSLGSGSPKIVFVNSTTTYTAKCVATGCSDSPEVSITVNVPTNPPSGGCSAISNDLLMGTWTVTGHPLVAKQFHGQWWLVQKINNDPEMFVVRGSEMLVRGDVSLSNSGYSDLVSCFAYTYSNYGGLEPPSTSTFPTPSGYTLGYEHDGTPYYTASGTPPSGCTDAYLTNSWTYASAGYNPPPKIGQSVDGNDMTMGSVNYSSSYPGTGIGTHATSEIIYDLGDGHSYTHFKATVGKDNEAFCGENKMIFKVKNNADGSVLATSPTIGNPDYSLPQTADMSVDISGVRYLKLEVEDGGDGIGCDHANWARARLTCSSSARIAVKDTVAPLFSLYPNVNDGNFNLVVNLDEDQPFEVALINSSGNIFKQESHQGLKGQNKLSFDSGRVQSGQYLLRVNTAKRVESQIVIIEK